MSIAGTARPAAAWPRDVPELLRRLLTDDPGRPRLTWYGPAGDRVELSAKVLDNWVAKTANLLVDELDAGPGSVVRIALPAHWRTVTWLLATWSVGACVSLSGSGGCDVLVSADPGPLAAAGRAHAVGVALPALATSFGPDLPDGALDAAIEVRSHGDVFVPFVRPVPDDPALDAGDLQLRHGELLPAAAAVPLPDRVRLLTGAGPHAAVSDLLAPLARLGSVVLHHDVAGLDPAALARLAGQEGITSP